MRAGREEVELILGKWAEESTPLEARLFCTAVTSEMRGRLRRLAEDDWIVEAETGARLAFRLSAVPAFRFGDVRGRRFAETLLLALRFTDEVEDPMDYLVLSQIVADSGG